MAIYILLTAFLFALISYYLAKYKDRDKYLAFLMGFFFGIFAILYYLCCDEGLARCPYCLGRIIKEATVCKHCGRNLQKTEK